MSVDNAHPSDYTFHLPDECLASIFQSLPSDDRNCCSLVCRRWLLIEAQSRRRLSLNAQSDLAPAIPGIFARFNSVTSLTLKCDPNAESISDETLISISPNCNNLSYLWLEECRQITADGVEALSKNCALLKHLFCQSCGTFSAKGLNAVVENCAGLETLCLKNIVGIIDPIVPGAAGSSLKDIWLDKVEDAKVFSPLITASKSLRTLGLVNCLGPLDGLLQSIADRPNETVRNVHLEGLDDIGDVRLRDISICCPNLMILRLVRLPNCTNAGIVMAAKRWRLLRKLHIEAHREINRIGDQGLMAVAENCPNLEELLLTGVILTLSGLRALAAKCIKLERLFFADGETFGDLELMYIAANCKAMKKLSLLNCQVSDHGIQFVAESCPNLFYLELYGVNLSQTSLQMLATNCVNLNRLAIGNSVTVGDAELLCISNCKALKSLWIVNCPVSDHGIQAVASQCPNLADLLLRNCPAVTLECVDRLRASLTVHFGMGAVPQGMP